MESCFIKFFVPMKNVTNGKNNKHIPQITLRRLLYHCSAVEIFLLKHIESCVRKPFVQMKVVINGKNNFCKPQTSKTLFCYCTLVVEDTLIKIDH